MEGMELGGKSPILGVLIRRNDAQTVMATYRTEKPPDQARRGARVALADVDAQIQQYVQAASPRGAKMLSILATAVRFTRWPGADWALTSADVILPSDSDRMILELRFCIDGVRQAKAYRLPGRFMAGSPEEWPGVLDGLRQILGSIKGVAATDAAG